MGTYTDLVPIMVVSSLTSGNVPAVGGADVVLCRGFER